MALTQLLGPASRMAKPFATIYVLCFGDHHALHARLLSRLKATTGAAVPVVVWLNQVCQLTAEWLRRFMPEHWEVVWSDENVPKYTLMRELFHGEHAPKSDWLIWFDDDTRITNNGWWQQTANHIIAKKDENPCYLGQPWYVDHLPGQTEFIEAASWYTGREWERVATRKKGKSVPEITFAQGSYWWLRTDVMRQIDWPDPRLVHNGGDTLLGEAIRQQKLPFHKFFRGVKPNDAKRRGRSDRPAGSTVDKRR